MANHKLIAEMRRRYIVQMFVDVNEALRNRLDGILVYIGGHIKREKPI